VLVWGLSTIVAAMLVACSSTSAPVASCAAPRSVAIEVDVTDSVTGRALADSATGSVQSGSYADSLVRVSDRLMDGGAQLGTYVVTLSRPGYTSWVRSGVRVASQGPCGNVEPTHIAALLQPPS
jgi:hypothetical protein